MGSFLRDVSKGARKAFSPGMILEKWFFRFLHFSNLTRAHFIDKFGGRDYN